MVSSVFPDLETIRYKHFFLFDNCDSLKSKLSINKKFFLILCFKN